MKKFFVGLAGSIFMFGLMTSVAFADGPATNIKAPFYIVNSCDSDNVTTTLAGGQVNITTPNGNTNLILDGEVKNLTKNTTYQVWVRNLSGGYTGTSTKQYTTLGYYDLTSLKTDKKGNGSFHIEFTNKTLKPGTYNLQVALNYDDSTTYGCTQIATQNNPFVTVMIKQLPIKVGPIHVATQDDIGTCNNVWAEDTFNKYYTITQNSNGTFNIDVVYKDGTFVTNTGVSPGACEKIGGNGPGNGNTVKTVIKGTMYQEYNGTVTGTLIPGASCTPSICVDTDSILNTLFNSGWSWTIVSPDNHWNWNNTYTTTHNGTFFDTSVSWPYKDKGDITN
jgi:hypothetical protein